MAVEIERKFLVSGTPWHANSGERIVQGYLNRDTERTVRVRIAGQQAFLTVKGKSTGPSRAEFEYAVPLEDAEAMLRLCDGPVIEKVRHKINHAGLTWEVDVFAGANEGLIVAEVELSSEDQHVDLPSWVTIEVTDDPRYFNSQLATHPFTRWRE